VTVVAFVANLFVTFVANPFVTFVANLRELRGGGREW
jgi:hypothetical protein